MPLAGIFRIDLAGGFAVLLWQRVPLPWLALVLPAMLLIPLGAFFVLARTYGRLFCSWACPQGYINEAATKSHLRLWGRRRPWTTRFERRYPKAARRRAHWWKAEGREWNLALARYTWRGLFLPPAAAFGAVSYLVDPARLWGYLSAGSWEQAPALAFFALAGIFYADLLLLQEKACRVCFFGYLQSVASYGQRTGVRRDPDLKNECHGCSGCRDICFAGVDPRQRAWEWARSTDLVFDQCVSCGDCLVACDDLTSRRGVPLIMQMPPRITGHPTPGTPH
jgi:polyferredoxin